MKRQLALMAAAAVIASASAATLSPEQALQRARGNAPARSRALNAAEMKLVHTATTMKGEAAAYIFAYDGGEGFSILSANDLAVPVLGYSNSGRLDSGSMPPALTWWLSQYAAQIEYAESMGITVDDSSRYKAPETLTAIEPLVKTKWDQGEPYNSQCPTSNGIVCPTGCVATSMAQAMNYFKYPEQGEGNITYRWGNRTLILDFSSEAFMWENMLDSYAGDYTEQQADAVAYLMKACGYSVEMSYAPGMSGAVSQNIINALKNYFKYDKNVRYLARDSYSYDEWLNICYDNLRNCGPIIYNGTDPIAGGHSFIVDGYDGNGYFHLNWGWGGMSDGYFSLDALTPVAQGTGGAMGGFNYSQDAVIGMQKPTGEPEIEVVDTLSQYGYSVVSLSGNELSFNTDGWSRQGWVNLSLNSMFFYFGASFEPVDGGEPVIVQGTLSGDTKIIRVGSRYIVNPKYGVPTIDIPELPDGKYKVTLMTKVGGDEGTWVPVATTYGYSNYCYVDIKGSDVNVENVLPKILDFESLELTSPLYYDRNSRLKAKVKNNTDLQLTACVTPKLYKNGEAQFTAETILITVDPGETIDYEWVTHFYMLDGADKFTDPSAYTLSLMNQDSGLPFGDFGTVNMTSTTSGFTLKLDNLSIAGVEPAAMEFDGTSYSKVYSIPDPENFTVDMTYRVSKGYFDTAVIAGIYKRSGSNGAYIPVTDYIYEATPFLGTDESRTVSIPVCFTENDPESLFYIRVQYIRNGVPVYLGQIIIHSDVTDVKEIVDNDSECEIEYFNLQGMKVAQPTPGMLLIRKQGSKTEKVIF